MISGGEQRRWVRRRVWAAFVPILDTRGYVNVGDTVTGHISHFEDDDLYAVDLPDGDPAGSVYRIAVQAAQGTDRVRPWLELVDSVGAYTITVTEQS